MMKEVKMTNLDGFDWEEEVTPKKLAQNKRARKGKIIARVLAVMIAIFAVVMLKFGDALFGNFAFYATLPTLVFTPFTVGVTLIALAIIVFLIS